MTRLLSIFNEIKLERLEIVDGNDANRFPGRWRNSKLLKFPISSGISISRLFDKIKVFSDGRFQMAAGRFSNSLSLKDKVIMLSRF